MYVYIYIYIYIYSLSLSLSGGWAASLARTAARAYARLSSELLTLLQYNCYNYYNSGTYDIKLVTQ